MDTKPVVRVAAIQMCSRQDRSENLALASGLLRQAAEREADIVALPENFSFLDREGDKLGVIEDLDSGPSIRLLREFSAKTGIVVVGGSVPLGTADGKRVTNTCLVFGQGGGLRARYDKIHLFDIALDSAHDFQESRYIAPGKDVVLFQCLGHMMGLSICYDMRFPELYRQLALAGAKAYFVPSAFTMRTGRDHWAALLRARAIENLAYVVAPAQWGRHNDRRESYGRTLIIDPWGQTLAEAPDRNCVIVADLDFAYLEDIRRRLPCLEHARLLDRAHTSQRPQGCTPDPHK